VIAGYEASQTWPPRELVTISKRGSPRAFTGAKAGVAEGRSAGVLPPNNPTGEEMGRLRARRHRRHFRSHPRHPYFLQEWGKHSWNVAKRSPDHLGRRRDPDPTGDCRARRALPPMPSLCRPRAGPMDARTGLPVDLIQKVGEPRRASSGDTLYLHLRVCEAGKFRPRLMPNAATHSPLRLSPSAIAECRRKASSTARGRGDADGALSLRRPRQGRGAAFRRNSRPMFRRSPDPYDPAGSAANAAHFPPSPCEAIGYGSGLSVEAENSRGFRQSWRLLAGDRGDRPPNVRE
jgi:hypothetical protein